MALPIRYSAEPGTAPAENPGYGSSRESATVGNQLRLVHPFSAGLEELASTDGAAWGYSGIGGPNQWQARLTGLPATCLEP